MFNSSWLINLMFLFYMHAWPWSMVNSTLHWLHCVKNEMQKLPVLPDLLALCLLNLLFESPFCNLQHPCESSSDSDISKVVNLLRRFLKTVNWNILVYHEDMMFWASAMQNTLAEKTVQCMQYTYCTGNLHNNNTCIIPPHVRKWKRAETRTLRALRITRIGKMAEFDLTAKIGQYLDRHLVFPLLEFLSVQEVSIVFLSGAWNLDRYY